jgi:23S rRNA G2445 N2-methylase RlmL
VSAAGSDSDDMVRWRAAIADATGLIEDDDGELLIRLRKAVGGGWEVLLRLTPRPLSARAWRTERYEGGLNACIAAAVVMATDPSPDDWFVDLMCGSGTLLVERLTAGKAARVVGYDISESAIAATKIHLRNAAIRGAKVELHEKDVRGADGSFNKLVVNLPWGTSVGSHEENPSLYADVLRTAARIAAPGATFCVLTHELRVFDGVLRDQDAWDLTAEHKCFQKGHWPHLYVLAN